MKFKNHAALTAVAALANTATAQDGAYGYVFLLFLFKRSCLRMLPFGCRTGSGSSTMQQLAPLLYWKHQTKRILRLKALGPLAHFNLTAQELHTTQHGHACSQARAEILSARTGSPRVQTYAFNTSDRFQTTATPQPGIRSISRRCCCTRAGCEVETPKTA